VALEALIYQI
jgi:hypothetical protein